MNNYKIAQKERVASARKVRALREPEPKEECAVCHRRLNALQAEAAYCPGCDSLICDGCSLTEVEFGEHDPADHGSDEEEE